MNILVIGGAGYIGSVTVEHLIESKHNVIILDNLSTGFKSLINPQATFYEGSMFDDKLLTKIFIIHKIEVVILYAAKIIVSESVDKPIEYFWENIGGLSIVLKSMVKNNIKNIIFSSSAAVYGESNKIPIHEQDEKKPCNPYGETKLYGEKLILDCNKTYKINFIIFRFFNVAGSSISQKYGMMKKKPSALIPAISDCIINNQQFKIFGNDYQTKDGTCCRDYIHVQDIAYAVTNSLLLLKNNESHIFNLSTNQGYTILDIVKIAQKLISPNLKYAFYPKRNGDPKILLASNDKAKKILNWVPKYTIEDMIISDYNFRKKYVK